jgi:type I restriction enzyme M protein
MLDSATKRRIDAARDILVGKVPDPKSQVEQITIALIYKFMDDMDAEAEELGGKRSFFAGEFARYGWAKLMRSGLGGHETLGLYAEAISRMPENPGVPALFRDIFKNAFLPYRDPETLRAFLKVIDEFEYDHSERLGDAFEYLLSVLGSQGDAGQFRTPRHIIDFIVDIVDPKKGETILDPACGTAGFLISAWKHIQAANRAEDGESTLTPDEQEKLASNIKGYDISPDMVRLSLANMYLHGFTDPHIVEYDTLTSDERWNEFADVILANPPFMSPKGGIRPHNRFSVPSNRSEVLFVDYMAEHLTPNGRAGIIVPEGVIFQSGKAYKALRKELVEKYLVAVVSLPAGMFNPYSGVKTSILILDRAGTKASDTIGFFKVTNDGFSLGAQRREVGGSELAEVLAEIAAYRAHAVEELWDGRFGRAVAKAEIAATGDYSLAGERYRTRIARSSVHPIVALGDHAEIRMGETLIKGDLTGSGVPIFSADTSNRPWAHTETTKLSFGPETIIVGARGTIGSVKHPRLERFTSTQTTIAVTPNTEELLPEYVAAILRVFDWRRITEGVGIPMITVANVRRIEIPFPSLEIQRDIVAEIDGYQTVIDGARLVVENYRPHIAVDPQWPIVRLGDVAAAESGFGFPLDRQGRTNEVIPFLKVSDMNLSGNEIYIVNQNHTVAPADLEALRAKAFPAGTVIFPKIGAAIATNKKRILSRPATYDNNVMGIVPDTAQLTSEYLYNYLVGFNLSRWASTAEPPSMKKSTVEAELIPLPPLEIQRAIAAELEAERALVDANRELIARMEKKIEAAIARVWGAAEAGQSETALAAE